MNESLIIDMLEQLPGYIGWKDKNFTFLGCNSNNALLLKIKNPRDIVGKVDHDLLDTGEANFHREHDEKVLTGHTIKTLHASTLSGNKLSYFQVKKPLIQGNIIAGIVYQCIEFIHPKLFLTMHDIDKRHCPLNLLPLYYEIEPQSNRFDLSPRELDCLFCILRGMSAKKIGEYLCLSKRTVEYYINNIKNKFSCHSKSELIDLAIKSNYLNIIPSRFLHEHTISTI